jgi:titin
VTPSTVPVSPPAIYATPANAQAAVNWVAPSYDGGAAIDSYTVQTTPGSLFPSSYAIYDNDTMSYQYINLTVADPSAAVVPIADVSTPGLSTIVSGLQNGRYYQFASEAHNVNGFSPLSFRVSPVLPIGVPDAPVIIGISSDNNYFLKLFWYYTANNGSIIVSYTITATPFLSVGPTGGGPYVPITVSSNGFYNNVYIPGLLNNTYYAYTMVSTNGVGTSISSIPYIADTNPTSISRSCIDPFSPFNPPGAPEITDVTGLLGPNYVIAQIFWRNDPFDNPCATEFTFTVNPGGLIYIFTDRTVSYQLIPQLAYDTSYNISMTSTNQVGTSPVSNIFTLFVAKGTQPPSPITYPPILNYTISNPPTIGSATSPPSLTNSNQVIFIIDFNGTRTDVNRGTATVTWTAPLNNGGSPIIGYRIVSYLDSNRNILNGAIDVSGTQTSTTFNVPCGIPTAFYVFAENAAGLSYNSGISNYVTALSVPSITGGFVTVSYSDPTMTINWLKAPLDGGSPVTFYDISLNGSIIDSVADISGALTYTYSYPVTTSGSYYYTIYARNSIGRSVPNTSANTIVLTLPSAPTGVSASYSYPNMTVTWSAPSSSGNPAFTSYTIYRNGTLLVSGRPTTPTSYTDSTITTTGSYTYTVYAVSSLGSTASTPSTAVVISVPSVPRSVTVGYNPAYFPPYFDINWVVPSSSGSAPITNYIVDISGNGSRVQNTVSSSTFYYQYYFVTGRSYYISVAAKNAFGDSAFANAVPYPITT